MDEQKSLEVRGPEALAVIVWEEPKKSYGNHTPLRFANLVIGGFSVHIEVQYDWDHDWCDSRGKFTDKKEPDAIENPLWRLDPRDNPRYFIPEVTEAYHHKGYLELGYSEEEATKRAHSHVLEDCLVAADPDRAGYSALGVTATASLKGVELGSDGLWGIEVKDIEDPYVLEVTWQVINEALSTATKNLAALKSA